MQILVRNSTQYWILENYVLFTIDGQCVFQFKYKECLDED